MTGKRAAPKARTQRQTKPQPPPKKKRGTGIKHVPDETTRNMVQLCMLNDFTHEQTAKLCGFSETTLKTHYVEELQHGKSRLLQMIAGNLYAIALNTVDRKAALTASIFLLKSKGGYNDRAAEQKDKDPDAITGTVRFELRLGDAKRTPEDA